MSLRPYLMSASRTRGIRMMSWWRCNAVSVGDVREPVRSGVGGNSLHGFSSTSICIRHSYSSCSLSVLIADHWTQNLSAKTYSP